MEYAEDNAEEYLLRGGTAFQSLEGDPIATLRTLIRVVYLSI